MPRRESFTVLVKSIEGEEDGHAHIIRGSIILKGRRYPFRAIAFGRIGGHNIHAELPAASRRRFKADGFTPDEIEETRLQLARKLLEGDLTLHPKAVVHTHR